MFWLSFFLAIRIEKKSDNLNINPRELSVLIDRSSFKDIRPIILNSCSESLVDQVKSSETFTFIDCSGDIEISGSNFTSCSFSFQRTTTQNTFANFNFLNCYFIESTYLSIDSIDGSFESSTFYELTGDNSANHIFITASTTSLTSSNTLAFSDSFFSKMTGEITLFKLNNVQPSFSNIDFSDVTDDASNSVRIFSAESTFPTQNISFTECVYSNLNNVNFGLGVSTCFENSKFSNIKLTSSSFLSVSTNIDYILYNCEIDSCTGSSSGFLNFADGTLTLSFCNFSNNIGAVVNPASYAGCLIFTSKELLAISNCIFEGDLSKDSRALIIAGKSSIADTTFSNFYSSTCGGAILYLNSTISSLSFERVTFESCKATLYGGALSLEIDTANTISDKSQLFINNCTFMSCTSNDGGSIYYISSNLTTNACLSLTNCIFQNNTALLNGSCIFGYTHLFDISECQFYNSSANSGSGGAIYLSQPRQKNHFIINCTFGGCSAGSCGGAIYFFAFDEESLTYTWNPISVHSCKFIDCSSIIEGGAISSGMANGTVITGTSDMLIDDSSFLNCQSAKGGGAYFQNYGNGMGNEETKVLNCIFDNCKGTTDGDAIYCSSHNITIQNTIFRNNFGPKTYLYAHPFMMSNCMINECLFSNNKLDGITLGGFQSNIHKCTFENYYVADLLNGIIQIQDDWSSMVKIEFTDCVFKNNKNRVFMFDVAKSVTISSCQFINNSNLNGNQFNNMGGCIYVSNSQLITISYCDFENNYALVSGSCVYSPTHMCVISSCNFNNNSVSGDAGGALYFEQLTSQTVTISDCSFTSCSSPTYGGAMYFYSLDQASSGYIWTPINVFRCTFIKCSSGVEGGAISSGVDSGGQSAGDNDMLVENCTFQECQSVKGGGIYFQDGHQTGDEEGRVVNCTFDNCQGTNGNAIYSRSYNFTLSECTFINNFGGDSYLYVYSNEAWVLPNISHCTFRGNKLDGIIFSSSMITIESCIFEDYDVSGSMSGIMNVQNDWLTTEVTSIMITFNNCKFRNNKHRSFMISNSAAGIVLNSCEFTNNSNTYGNQYNNMGACIYGDNAMYTMINYCTFENNYALTHGSCIYGPTHLFQLTSCNFNNNSVSSDSGGALYFEQLTSQTVTISDCSFTSCSSPTYGGAMYFYSLDQASSGYIWTPINVFRCTFIKCSSGVEGGAISSGVDSGGQSAGDNDMLVENCTFQECQSVKGGGIYFQDGHQTGDEEGRVVNCTFDNCQGTNGNAIYSRSYNFTLSECTFINNFGGDSYLYVYSNEAWVLPNISHCTFRGNKLDGIIFSSSMITIESCIFEDYDVSGSMSGIMNVQNDWLTTEVALIMITFNNCKFRNNKHRSFMISNSAAGIVLNSCEFTNNSNTYGNQYNNMGACIYGEDCFYLLITSCSFKHNIVLYKGSCFYGLSHLVRISYSTFLNNSATHDTGGAIYMEQTQTENMTILHCSFDSCSAGTYGGAMYFYAKDQSVTSYSWIPIEIRDCTFNNYSSTEEGGAISSGFASISSSSGDNDMFIVNCAFSLCESVKGGCIYFQDGKETGDEEGRIENCTFNNCKGQLGTCIYTRAYNFSLTDSTFSNNINGESYLYIAMDEENVAPIIQRCKFQGNKDARIVIAIKEHLDLVDCEFVSNSQSESDGGGIMLDQTSIPKGVLFTNCIFNYNSATKGYGGAVFITTTIFELSKCSFNRNSALNGGALYIKSDTGYIHLFDDTSTAKVLECSFGSNAASESGGSIYTSTSDSLLISSCNFTYSNANDLGSSIYSDLRGQLTINKLNILASQLFETPSIYITGTSTSGAVLINGSCFSGTKYANDEKASFIIFESSGTIQLTGDVCISGDKESTINGIDSSLPDSYFNCNECEAPTIPDITDVPSSGVIEPTIDSSSSSDDDGSGGDDSQGGGGNKKLGGGSIAGIVIGVIVFVAILIFLVIFFIKRKTETEEKEEAISQEVVDDSVKTFSQEPAWSNNFDSNEYQNSTQNDNYEDPFMREFEEAGA